MWWNILHERTYVDWLKWVSLEDEFDLTTLSSSNMSALFQVNTIEKK